MSTGPGSQTPALPGGWRRDLEPLLQRIAELAENLGNDADLYGGLVDLDTAYALVKARVEAAQVLYLHPDTSDPIEKIEIARSMATGALTLLDALQSANLSLDQRTVITDSPEMEEIQGLFHRLLEAGGTILFNAGKKKKSKERRLLKSVAQSISKHVEAEEARPYVKPGEEEISTSEKMVLPRSQAILLIEEELIPEAERRLVEEPGSKDLQEKRDALKQTLDLLKTARFFPRARPIGVPVGVDRNIVTDAITAYTSDGEPVVTLRLPTITSSGNRYDLLLDEMKAQIISDCAGRGVSEDLDVAVRKARATTSGKRGSWTEIVNKLNIEELYRSMAVDFPFLKRIENREEIRRLADLAEAGDRRAVTRAVSDLARTHRNLLVAAAKGEIPGPS